MYSSIPNALLSEQQRQEDKRTSGKGEKMSERKRNTLTYTKYLFEYRLLKYLKHMYTEQEDNRTEDS